MCLQLQPMVISLHCPMRQSHEIVIFMVSILQVCGADCVLRFAGSAEEGFQVLGIGPQISWQHLCDHQEYGEQSWAGREWTPWGVFM